LLSFDRDALKAWKREFLLAVPVSVLWVGLEKSYSELKLGCEKHVCRVTC
jgi:hypothetical protein